MGYWDDSGAFFIPSRYTYDQEGNCTGSGERIECGSFTLMKFKECLDCTHFRTACESYVCRHRNGKSCLLELGVNYFTKKGG